MLPVNTVTTDGASCSWGTDIDGYNSGTIYAATLVATATVGSNGHINSWFAKLSLTSPLTIAGFPAGSAQDTVNAVIAGDQTGTDPDFSGTEFSWGSIANNGADDLDLGSNLVVTIGAFGTYRELTCTVKLTGSTVDHDNEILVDPIAGDDSNPNCGTDPLTACKTIATAQSRSTATNRPNILLKGGATYTGGVALVNNQTIKGGYNSDFSSQSGGASTINGGVSAHNVTATVDKTTIYGPGGTNTSGVFISGVSDVTLSNNIINSGTPTGSGSSAYGVRATGGTFSIIGGSVTAQPGIAGNSGGDGSGGANGASANSTRTGASGSGSGGKGGDGGASYPNAGSVGATPTGGGSGGAAGQLGSSWSCTGGGDGGNGNAGGSGAKGSGGGTNSLNFTGSLWGGSPGGSGAAGFHGGGGGGGASGRCLNAGYGGGGGQGGTGGTGGSGGDSGGGSFGIYAINPDRSRLGGVIGV